MILSQSAFATLRHSRLVYYIPKSVHSKLRSNLSVQQEGIFVLVIENGTIPSPNSLKLVLPNTVNIHYLIVQYFIHSICIALFIKPHQISSSTLKRQVCNVVEKI